MCLCDLFQLTFIMTTTKDITRINATCINVRIQYGSNHIRIILVNVSADAVVDTNAAIKTIIYLDYIRMGIQ